MKTRGFPPLLHIVRGADEIIAIPSVEIVNGHSFAYRALLKYIEIYISRH